ncbi:hypothetical protein QJS10_CPA10g02005 [Acorus calamus]|uniref:Uncharacterized protein n=1 Tax=Acorus calamus TaxID=4465 RepID=A0AAV9E4U7_ACOCL|nr:hypothetical protein QJS10_CPA10g02005 [Acorus calamus]
MTNKGSPYNSSHPPSVLAVLVLLLVAAVAITTNVVVVGEALNGVINGTIAECHGEEGELLLVVGESENGLRRHLLAYISNGALKPDKAVYNTPRGQPYKRGCNPYDHCRLK